MVDANDGAGLCPRCHGGMEPGFGGFASQLFWSREALLGGVGLGESERLTHVPFFLARVQLPGSICRSCSLVVLSYGAPV
jgi:hypothetical protein